MFKIRDTHRKDFVKESDTQIIWELIVDQLKSKDQEVKITKMKLHQFILALKGLLSEYELYYTSDYINEDTKIHRYDLEKTNGENASNEIKVVEDAENETLRHSSPLDDLLIRHLLDDWMIRTDIIHFHHLEMIINAEKFKIHELSIQKQFLRQRRLQLNKEWYLTRIYINKSLTTMKVIVEDPEAGVQFDLKVHDDFYSLNIPFSWTRKKAVFSHGLYPVEDAAIGDLLDRVTFELDPYKDKPRLTLTESNGFVNILRKMFEAADFDYFINVNRISLAFREEIEPGYTGSSIKHKVLQTIRSNAAICNFLIASNSTLKVVFEGLGNGESNFLETMDWLEFINYLKGHRSPYVGIQILPVNGESENWKQTPISKDGGFHPQWNTTLEMDYKPQPNHLMVVETEVMNINNTFVVISIKRDPYGNVFPSAYDPLSANEYILEHEEFPKPTCTYF